MENLEDSAHEILVPQNRHTSNNSIVRIAYICELFYRLMQSILILWILYYKRSVTLENPLKKFLCLYFCLNSARTISFASKVKSKIMDEITSSSSDLSGLETYESLLEMVLFVLYFRGFDYLELCEKCNETEPLLYYSSKCIIFVEIALFILPLVLIFIYIIVLAHRADLFGIEVMTDV